MSFFSLFEREFSNFRTFMRPQIRGFTVEIKARRRSQRPLGLLVSRDSWADPIAPDDLPERDVYADLVDGAPPSEARRAAEKLFGRFVADQKPCRRRSPPKRRYPLLPNLWLR